MSIIEAKSDVVVPWRNIPSSEERFAELRGLNLRSHETYQLLLRAVSNAGLTSDVIISNVTIEQYAPLLNFISKLVGSTVYRREDFHKTDSFEYYYDKLALHDYVKKLCIWVYDKQDNACFRAYLC